MNQNEIKLSREELYALIWEKPMTKLAQKFGFSDNGFGKSVKSIISPFEGIQQKG